MKLLARRRGDLPKTSLVWQVCVISSLVRLREVRDRHVHGISACDNNVHGKFLCGRLIARKLTGDKLKVVWVKFSTLS